MATAPRDDKGRFKSGEGPSVSWRYFWHGYVAPIDDEEPRERPNYVKARGYSVPPGSPECASKGASNLTGYLQGLADALVAAGQVMRGGRVDE